ncbi:TIGR03936 family radical SAM-associated protein, partial [bacterium]|nr:TIGR03936 family radical SAM-associated protein [bacterium]
LPWDGIFAQIDREFLRRDWEAAQRGETVPDCRLDGACGQCAACDGELQHIFAERGIERPGPDGIADDGAGGTPASPEGGEQGFDPRNADPTDPGRERDRWRKWRDRSPGKCWHRVVYAKTGDAAFWGHLDFQRQVRLALRRAGLPAAYSQGFNPQPLLKFGPPLPVGVAGDAEMLDLAFTHLAPAWEETLNRHLPAGVRVLASAEVGPVLSGAIDKDVDRYDYRAVLPPPGEGGPEPEASRRAIASFLDTTSRIYLRRRPKGDIEVDVRSLVCGDRLTVEDAPCPETGGAVLNFSLQRPPGEAGLPVFDFLAAVCGGLLPEPRLARVRRTALLARRRNGGWMSPLVRILELNQRLWLRKHLSA